jgi:hypothetical protein
MMEDRFLKRLRKKARKGVRGWPIATIAFYGSNLSLDEGHCWHRAIRECSGGRVASVPVRMRRRGMKRLPKLISLARSSQCLGSLNTNK